MLGDLSLAAASELLALYRANMNTVNFDPRPGGRKPMRRREFIMLIGVTAGLPLAVRAQDAGGTYRLGVLWPFPRNAPEAGLLSDELRRHGFIEGQNLTIEYRAWVSHVDLISGYAAELVNARYGPCRNGAPASHLPMARNRGSRRLCRLWTALRSNYSTACHPATRPNLSRRQGRRHPRSSSRPSSAITVRVFSST